AASNCRRITARALGPPPTPMVARKPRVKPVPCDVASRSACQIRLRLSSGPPPCVVALKPSVGQPIQRIIPLSRVIRVGHRDEFIGAGPFNESLKLGSNSLWSAHSFDAEHRAAGRAQLSWINRWLQQSTLARLNVLEH